MWRWGGAEVCVDLLVRMCVVCACLCACVMEKLKDQGQERTGKGCVAPTPCPPPSPSSCSLSPLSWWLQPCNSPALKAKINRCQQLVFWVVADVPPPCPCPYASGLLVPSQVQARLSLTPVGAQEGLRRAKGGWPHPFIGLDLGKA